MYPVPLWLWFRRYPFCKRQESQSKRRVLWRRRRYSIRPRFKDAQKEVDRREKEERKERRRKRMERQSGNLVIRKKEGEKEN